MDADQDMDVLHKNNADQLDGFATLVDPHSVLEEEKFPILSPEYLEAMEDQQPYKIDSLFKDEDIYLGDASAAGLDSQTLPILFRPQSFGKTRRKLGSDKSTDTPAKIRTLVEDGEFQAMGSAVCKAGKLDGEYEIPLPETSPLRFFIEGYSKCTLKTLLASVLKYTFENVNATITGFEPPSLSVMGDEMSIGEKKPRKQWSKEEEQELIKILQHFGSIKNVPEEIWNNLATRFDRTICSIHAKAKNLLKSDTASTRTAFNGTKTYLEMIASALNSFPTYKATKEEILEKISVERKLAVGEIEKGVVQCLSRRFERFPGVYKIKEGVAVQPKESSRNSVKDRLIYILGVVAENHGITLGQIKEIYYNEFKDELIDNSKISVEGNQTVWEKTIAKTLLKNSEFDKSLAKTTYGFKKV